MTVTSREILFWNLEFGVAFHLVSCLAIEAMGLETIIIVLFVKLILLTEDKGITLTKESLCTK